MPRGASLAAHPFPTHTDSTTGTTENWRVPRASRSREAWVLRVSIRRCHPEGIRPGCLKDLSVKAQQSSPPSPESFLAPINYLTDSDRYAISKIP